MDELYAAILEKSRGRPINKIMIFSDFMVCAQYENELDHPDDVCFGPISRNQVPELMKLLHSNDRTRVYVIYQGGAEYL